MSYTRLELVAEGRAAADAEEATRWNATTVLRLLDVVFHREWTDLLNASPFLRTAVINVTPDANGQVALSTITTGSADTAQTLYRVIGITWNGEPVHESDLRDNLNARSNSAVGAIARRFWFSGTNLCFSNDLIGQELELTFNCVPCLPSDLAADDSTVDFPSPYEFILALELAALMMMKGDTETEASVALHQQADVFRSKLEGDIARRSINPYQWRAGDDAASWASR